MKLGLIARMDLSGLGVQTKALHDMLNPHKTLVIDSTPFNGREQHLEWYAGAMYSEGFPSNELIREFLNDLDVVITCEVPYNNNLYDIAREMGVKTVLQPNAELNPHFVNRRLSKPDYMFLPSTWYQSEYRMLRVPTYLCPPPIMLKPEPLNTPKEAGKLKVLHVAGRRAARDRNGTLIVEKLNISGVEIVIHDQANSEVTDQDEIYNQGYHLMLMPRRYGGLCLPMIESLGYGLPVSMPNISPNNDILPQEWLYKVNRPARIMLKRQIRMYEPDANDIMNMLIRFRDMESMDEEYIKARQIYDDYQTDLDKWHEYLELVVS